MCRGFRPLLIQLWGLQSLINGDGVLANYGAGRPWQLENGVAAFPPPSLANYWVEESRQLIWDTIWKSLFTICPVAFLQNVCTTYKSSLQQSMDQWSICCVYTGPATARQWNYTRIITCTRTHTIMIIIITNTRRQSDRNTTANDALIKHQIK